MPSLKASSEGLKRIKQARELKGLAIDREEWLEEASKLLAPERDWTNSTNFEVSIGTWKRFLQGKPVRTSYFQAFCQVLQLDWQEVADIPKSQNPTHCHWDTAPDASNFYSRETELATLKQWAIADRCRAIAILAMGGTGKTSLSIKFAQNIADEFNFVIWRSLREAPTPEKTIADLVAFLSQQQEIDLPDTLEGKISRLLHYFRAHRCLVILDNAESILETCSYAGAYRAGYSGYEQLWCAIGESSHQSCIIITSREQFKEIRRLSGLNLPVRCLELGGLRAEASQMLSDRGLQGTVCELEDLINCYWGNPLALQIVPDTINKLFDGSISAFLQSGSVVFADICDLLDAQFARLSEAEQCLMYWLAINRIPVDEAELIEDAFNLTPRTIRECLDSLSRRYLIQSTQEGLTLQNVVMEYVSERLIHLAIEQLSAGELTILKNHALIKASAPDYLRESQERMLLQPIAQFISKNQTPKAIASHIQHLIRQLQEGIERSPIGYAAGNLLNLLIQLKVDLTGWDFSYLSIFQAYLPGVELQRVNFAQCSFSKTVFSQALGSIFTVAFSPVGTKPAVKHRQLLATGGMDGQIRLWEVSTGTQMLAWQAHADWIRCVAFSPDGKLLASCGNDRLVKVWDKETTKTLHVFRGHQDWVWSVYFMLEKRLVVSASSDRTAKVWNLDSGDCIYTFCEPDREVWSVAFSNDGQTLATGGADCVRLWNVWTNQCLKTFGADSARVRTLAFSPDGQTLATSSEDGKIRFWDVESGECWQSVPTAPTAATWAVKFSADGQTVMSCGTDKIQLWNLGNLEPQMTLHEPHHRIRSLAYSAERQLIAVGSDDRLVRIWNAKTGEAIKTLQGYSDRIWTVAVSPVAEMGLIYLASGSDDGKIRLWNAATGECLRTFSGHQGRVRHVSFSPDGTLLASASHDRSIKLWNVKTGECLKTWRAHGDWVWSVLFTNNGKSLISAGDDRIVRLWNLETNSSQVLGNLETEWMWAMASHPCQSVLATAGTSQTINFWDLHNGACLGSLTGHDSRIRAIAFNARGQLIASSSDDLSVRLWRVETKECIGRFFGHEAEIRTLTFLPATADAPEMLASASDDLSIRLWDTRTGDCSGIFKGHQSRIWSICYSHQLKILFSCSEDETIKLWDVFDGKCISTLRMPKVYEGMNLEGVSGLTDATLDTLRVLGADL